MSYDITFCMGENCKRMEQCHRYLQLLKYRADKDPDKPTYVSMTKPTNPETCTLFWEEKQ